jgi:hypothetical protein
VAHRRPSTATVPISIRLPADLRADLERVSRERDVTVSWIIVETLRRWQSHQGRRVRKPVVIDEDA